jgi:hypothetical protein
VFRRSEFRVPGSEFRVGGQAGIVRLDLFDEEFRQAPVQVIAAEAGVAVGGEHLKDAFTQFEDGEVERAAAQVVNGDLRALAQAVQTVGQRGGGRLVHDAFDGEAGQFARALGRWRCASLK